MIMGKKIGPFRWWTPFLGRTTKQKMNTKEAGRYGFWYGFLPLFINATPILIDQQAIYIIH
jgi:hypothetical protein